MSRAISTELLARRTCEYHRLIPRVVQTDHLLSSTVATYQTLLRSERLKKFDPSHMKAVIVDEAHHAAAPSYVLSLVHLTMASYLL